MTLGMTQADVAALMAGYPSSEHAEKREFDSHGHPLARESALKANDDERTAANECDHCLATYFDEDGYLVGKHGDTYLK